VIKKSLGTGKEKRKKKKKEQKNHGRKRAGNRSSGAAGGGKGDRKRSTWGDQRVYYSVEGVSAREYSERENKKYTI